MAVYQTYDVVGTKEDVSDIISNISPTDTPFVSSIGSDSSTQRTYEWQEDVLAAAATNAQIEGFDATEGSNVPTTMRTNYTQIMQKTIKVSGSLDKTALYGRAKESAYQMAKKAKEVKRDLELAMIGNGQTKVLGDDSTARKFDSAQAMIDSTMIVHTGGSSTPPSEANLLTALQKVWANGVDPSVVQCTGDDSQVIADFAKASGRYRTLSNNADPRKIINVVDLYVSPFGQVKVVLNRWLLSTDTIVFSPEYWSKVVFRNWFREVLAKTGDNTKQMIVGEFGLKHKNFFASALIRKIA